MQEKIARFLADLKKRKDIFGYSEAATKQSIILYLLQLLGWNPFDSEEVKPEYGVEERKVDYALRVYSTSKVFIEVKKVDEPLAPHEQQLIRYATTESVKLAVLTNGITWWLYLPLVEGKWDQKKFYTIDVIEQDSYQAAEKFVEFLSQSATVSGAAIHKAESVFKDKKKGQIISNTLPIAWNKLVESADEILVQLLKESSEKLCGYEIDTEAVIQFLDQNHNKLLLTPDSLRAESPSFVIPHKTPANVDKEQADKEFHRSKEKILKVVINWQRVGKGQPLQVFDDGRGVHIFLATLKQIKEHIGIGKFQELLDFQVYRGMLLSKEPTKYHRQELDGFYVLTYNSTDEKAKIITDVIAKFGLPPDFISVKVVDK